MGLDADLTAVTVTVDPEPLIGALGRAQALLRGRRLYVVRRHPRGQWAVQLDYWDASEHTRARPEDLDTATYVGSHRCENQGLG
jgi:hypothetical protein